MEEYSFATHIEQVAEKSCKESFRVIFDHFSPKIYAFALSKSLSEAEASDVVQEVLSSVWAKAKQFNSAKGNAQAWIFTIARNACYDVHRKNSKHSNHISSDDIWNMDEVDLPNTQNEMSEQVYFNEVKEHMNSLPPEQQEVLSALFIEGLSHKEYSLKYKVPLGTVKSRSRLALSKLKKIMEDK